MSFFIFLNQPALLKPTGSSQSHHFFEEDINYMVYPKELYNISKNNVFISKYKFM